MYLSAYFICRARPRQRAFFTLLTLATRASVLRAQCANFALNRYVSAMCPVRMKKFLCIIRRNRSGCSEHIPDDALFCTARVGTMVVDENIFATGLTIPQSFDAPRRKVDLDVEKSNV